MNSPILSYNGSLLWSFLDRQMQAQFDELQWATNYNDEWCDWNNEARALWCQWQMQNDCLPKIERMKLDLWQALGRFAIDKPVEHPTVNQQY
ncbi:MAG: hypothetical protein AAGH78_04645 [Cyanobacteria bacterium P01_H01_bin.58]